MPNPRVPSKTSYNDLDLLSYMFVLPMTMTFLIIRVMRYGWMAPVELVALAYCALTSYYFSRLATRTGIAKGKTFWWLLLIPLVLANLVALRDFWWNILVSVCFPAATYALLFQTQLAEDAGPKTNSAFVLRLSLVLSSKCTLVTAWLWVFRMMFLYGWDWLDHSSGPIVAFVLYQCTFSDFLTSIFYDPVKHRTILSGVWHVASFVYLIFWGKVTTGEVEELTIASLLMEGMIFMAFRNADN